MKLEVKQWAALQSLASKHGGVFTVYDLSNFFLAQHPVELQQRLKPFLRAKVLYRFSRGFYVTEGFKLEILSQRICPASAISFGSVLAKELLIGSIPQKTVYAVKIGPSRTYASPLGQVAHLGISPNLWFGYNQWKSGVRYADKEKAFLDTLYFYQKGAKFSFNIYADIQTDRLDDKVLKRYLNHYKNQKFKKFVEGVIHGKYQIG